MTTHTIDATNKKIGRVASEAAALLIGKNNTSFVRNKIIGSKVEIVNTSKALIDERKKNDKEYATYSGYPGGIKTETVSRLIERKGYSEIFRKAVYGMLPQNKLKKGMMKNLTITE
ncbi:MAG TPA: 50S ribosomal protein L13 [Candidatus Paceibacterota bacterium]